MLVAVKILGDRIIGDQQVEPAVVIHINKNRRQAVISPGVGDASLYAHISKSAVAVVVKQMVALARQAARAAHHCDSAKLAEPERDAAFASDGRIVGIELYVTGNEDVEESVVVVIAPGRTRRPSTERDSSFFRNVGKRAVVIIVVKAVLSQIGNVHVGPAVVIEIAHHHAEAPALVSDSGLVGYVGEGAVVIIVEQHRPRWRYLPFQRERR